MSKTVPRHLQTKNYSIEELQELAKSLKWSQFVSKYTDHPKTVRYRKINFQARYGFFLKVTGVGVFAGNTMIRFIPCVCPIRSMIEPILNGGGHFLVDADMLYKRKTNQYKGYMLNNGANALLRAWCSIMDPVGGDDDCIKTND
jgi:hypothetical protein